MKPPIAPQPGPAGDDDLAAVRERLAWIVRLRWVAIAGVVVVTLAAWRVGLVPSPLPLTVGALAMAAGNLLFVRRVRLLEGATREAHEHALVAQILFDLLALFVLCAIGGGEGNPFAVFFAFHMAIGAMLLRPRVAFALGAIGCGLFAILVVGDHADVLPLQPLATATRAAELALRVGHVSAMLLMMLGVVYFVQSVAERLRQAERLRLEHERVALSREKFARVGELSAGVAHSIRNPLHGLLNSVELIGPHLDGDPDTEETLSLMREALRRIETVTQRLLDLTRDVPVVRVPIDLDELCSETLRLVSPRVRGSAASLETDLGQVGECDVDPTRFEEALANVLNNAIDACAAGGRVVVRTTLGPVPDGTVVVEVEDTGTGIAPGDLGSVFAPFFTTKAVGEGTGLGLAITRRIIEEHGGHVTVDSTLGEGTRVRFVFPRRSHEASPGGDEA
jgi:signal transduction histidine kinase